MEEKRRPSEPEIIGDRMGKENERATWGSKVDFFLNVIGYTIGTGNVWRFSYLCFKNGGGAFLIPYVLLMMCCGLPILFMEVAMGQFSKQSCIGAWRVCPIVQGVGFAALQVGFYFLAFVNILLGWCFFYFFHTFTSGPMPWTTCGNTWNTDACEPFAVSIENATNTSVSLESSNWNENTSSSAEEFWNNYVLHNTEGIHDIGGLTNWRMLLCYLLSWVVSYLCIFKGVKSTGKVVYVTATMPFAMLLVLLIRGLTLEGSVDGILYFVTPVPSRLLDSTVWVDAGGQVLFTLGVCYNVLYSCGSYNKFNNNCYKQSYLVVLVCGCTSLVIGVAVFSIIGHLAHVRGTNVTQVTEGGPGLVFEIIPVGLSFLPKPHIWSGLFFLMMVLIIIDSGFATLEAFITTLGDIWPDKFGDHSPAKYKIGCCVVLAISGLPLLLDGGIYIFEIINNYGGGGICILWTAFFEAIGLAWIYGVDNFFEDVKTMLGFYPHKALKYCYKFVTPFIILAIFLFYCASYKPLKIGNYEYPWWVNLIGWMMSGGVIISVPIVAIRTLLKTDGTWRERWNEARKNPNKKPIKAVELGLLSPNV